MRPKKKAAEKKETVVKVRVTEGQKEALDKAAAKDGMDLSSFARHLMIERARHLGIEV
jgi:uncharacterized protein (DUF1778 family)